MFTEYKFHTGYYGQMCYNIYNVTSQKNTALQNLNPVDPKKFLYHMHIVENYWNVLAHG